MSDLNISKDQRKKHWPYFNDYIAGPILHSPVTNIEVKLHHFEMTPGTVLPVISACASACIYKAFEEAECFLMEPIMFMEVRYLILIYPNSSDTSTSLTLNMHRTI